MRPLLRTAPALLLCTLGCASGANSPQTPAAAPATDPPALDLAGATARSGDLAQSTLARYRIQLDAATGNVAVEPLVQRNLTQTDDVYTLPVTETIAPNTFTVDAVSWTPTEVQLRYTWAHPFKAPLNLDAPVSALNRADLGVCGQVLFVHEGTETYFGSEVTTNTSLVLSADGFVKPGALVATPGMSADTFPYMLLVDELADNRNETSNGGFMTGNYDPPNGGWQRANMGAARDQWTGYGFVHQGQSATRTLVLDRSVLGGAAVFTFDAAILVKYIDPRGGVTGGEKRSNRLPPATVDTTRFVYRMPHGALDIERIELIDQSADWTQDLTTDATLAFRVRDWDARAIETSDANLADDSTITHVAQGESGLPGFAVDIPGVLGAVETFSVPADVLDNDSAYPGGDGGPDSGHPGDELTYARQIFATPAVNGLIPGFARATDVTADNEDWRYFLDEGLGQITSQQGELPTYQAFKVNVLAPGGNLPPVVTPSIDTPIIFTGGTVSLRLAAYSDPDGDPIDVSVDWTNTGAFVFAATLPGAGGSDVVVVSPITYTWTGANPDMRTLPVRYTDSITPPITVNSLTFEVRDGCTLTVGDIQLASLAGATVRAGIADTGDLNGIQVRWTDISGEAEYAVYGAAWAPGAAFPTTPILLGTVAANGTTFNHTPSTSALPVPASGGSRFVYLVRARCIAGGIEGPNSQLAVATIHNFQNLSGSLVASNIPGTGQYSNGWSSTGSALNGSPFAGPYYGSGGLLKGNFSYALVSLSGLLSPGTLHYGTLWTPQIPTTDLQNLGAIATSRVEFVHGSASVTSIGATAGFTVFSSITQPPSHPSTNPAAAWQLRWPTTPVVAGLGFNDNTPAPIQGRFPGIAGAPPAGNNNWSGLIGLSFTALDLPGTLAPNYDQWVVFATGGNGGTAGHYLDDIAWLVY